MGSVSEKSAWSSGQIIDNRFKVIRALGEGGMGVVLEAWHEELRKPIAIKFLRHQGLGAGDLAERFLREARSAARLQSEHAVRVLDAKMLDDGTPYIVMERLEGLDLAELLKRQGPLPPAVAVDHTLQALTAVAEAHASGMVHRDLKPSNLFLTRRSDGSPLVKVLDFGLAKAVAGEAGADAEPALTSTHEILGSPAYMSPEQLCDSKNVDQQSDIWALGALLYQLLCGRLPFDQTSRLELTVAILTAPPAPLRSVLPSVPKGLDKAVMACLEKDKANRHADAAALATALRPFAPSSCQGLVDQIVRTMAGAQTRKPATDGAVASGRQADGHASTLIQNAHHVAQAPRKGRGRKVAFAALAFAAVAGGVGWFVQSRHSPERAAAPAAMAPAQAPLLEPPAETETSSKSDPVVEPAAAPGGGNSVAVNEPTLPAGKPKSRLGRKDKQPAADKPQPVQAAPAATEAPEPRQPAPPQPAPPPTASPIESRF